MTTRVLTTISEEKDRVAFAEQAASRFAEDSSLTTFGNPEPGNFLAIRWGIDDSSVLVVKVDAEFQPRVYQKAVKEVSDGA